MLECRTNNRTILPQSAYANYLFVFWSAFFNCCSVSTLIRVQQLALRETTAHDRGVHYRALSPSDSFNDRRSRIMHKAIPITSKFEAEGLRRFYRVSRYSEGSIHAVLALTAWSTLRDAAPRRVASMWRRKNFNKTSVNVSLCFIAWKSFTCWNNRPDAKTFVKIAFTRPLLWYCVGVLPT